MAMCCRALRAALTDDLALARRLLANARAHHNALLANDYGRLGAVQAEGAEIGSLQEATGARRQAALSALATTCGMSTSEEDALPSLSDLSLMLPIEEAKGLLALRASLLDVEQAIRAANERNRALVLSALDVFHFAFHAVAELTARTTGYGAGTHEEQLPTFYLDHHA
jgi:hypothetical protein